MLVLHKAKVVLRQRTFLLAKLVLAFHRNKDIVVLPSMYPASVHQKEIIFQCLDVVPAVRVFSHLATASV